MASETAISDADLDAEIAALEAEVLALRTRLTRLKRVRAGRLGGVHSGTIRRKGADERDRRIAAALRAGLDHYRKRNGGLLKRVSEDFGVSEKHVGQLFRQIKQEMKLRRLG